MKIKQLFIILAVIAYLLPISAQVSKTINVTTPGTLSTLLTPDELNTNSVTYSNASLIGPWIDFASGNPDIYVIFDGNGVINEMGGYYDHKIKNIGTYSVTPNGAVTTAFELSSNGDTKKVYTASGQLIAPDSLSIITFNSISMDPLTNYMVRIPNPGELAGTWNGSIENSDYANLSLTIDNSGKVTSPSTWMGYVFTRMGKVIGFIQNDDGTCWHQFSFGDCVFDGNNKILGIGNSECRNTKGTITLTRDTNVYSNASLMGTWVPVTDGASDHGTYIIFDGNGIINESGDYYNHKKKDIGTYTVTPSGAITFTASIIQNNGEQTVFTCSGQFITPDSLSNIAINSIPLDPLTNYMIRTSNPGELAGTWNGSIYNSDYANLSITIDNSGKVTSPSTWIGHVFTRMGKVIGFIQNDDGTCWNQFTFGDCTFDGNNNIYGPVNSECTNTKGTISLMRVSTGINEQITDKLIIYPNPVSNEFYLNSLEKNMQVSIYDLSGGLCLTRQVSSNEYINVSTLPQGVYMVKITTEKGAMMSKLIKK